MNFFSGAILVYDISSEDSFEKIKMWIKELKKVVGTEIVCVIVGNKKDLIKDQKIEFDLQSHIDYANKEGCMHFLTSAKLNENIDELFLDISKKMIKAHDDKQTATSSLNRSNSLRRRLQVENDSVDAENAEEATSNSRCCGR
jgi:Ras-related protein Rab-21